MGWTTSHTGRGYAAASAVLLHRLMGQGYPAIADVAAELGVSKNTADRWLSIAEKYGQVIRIKKAHGSTRFVYVFDLDGEFWARGHKLGLR